MVAARRVSARVPCGGFGGGGIRRAHRQDELARIGEIALENLEALNHREITREQVKDIDVEVQA